MLKWSFDHNFDHKKISKIEGFNVRFMSNGKDVRGDMDIPTQYQAQKMSKNSYSVGEFKQKREYEIKSVN